MHITNAEISISLQSCAQTEEISVISRLRTLEISDHNQNNVEKEMTEALNAIIATGDVYTLTEARGQFEGTWSLRMAHIRKALDPSSFLDTSIQSVSQKYHDRYKTICINHFIAKATGFIQAPAKSSCRAAPNLLERWKANLFSDISNLTNKCVVETEFSSSSTHDSSTIRNYVCIVPSGRLSDTSILNEKSRDSFKWEIFQELIDHPLNDSNHFCLNRFLNQVHERLLKSTLSAFSIIGNDVVYEQIIECINRTTNHVNSELRLVGWKLSTDFLSTMHLNAVVLLIIVNYQKQEKEFSEQLEDLERKKPSLKEYFLAKMTSNVR